MRIFIASILLITFLFQESPAQNPVLICKNGSVEFMSEAPLETIRAKSTLVQGAVSTFNNEFFFEVAILSFEGFNSQLQREHFFENYMETERFPKATFTGKIVEEVDWEGRSQQRVRVKGTLNIHGVDQERILYLDIIPEGSAFRVRSAFELDVKDHDIYIPRMVDQKISPVIEIKVDLQIKGE